MRLRLLIIHCLTFGAAAQTARQAADGVYTSQQAERGKAVWAAQCAVCHGAQAAGGDEAPGLIGEEFWSKWRTRTAGDLFENVRATMPAGQPGTLSPSTTADILAYVFAANHLRPGTAELSSQSAALQKIRLGNGGLPAPSANPNAPAVYAAVEGRPIDTLPPEMSGNLPAFPQQTRAPYHATAPFKVTTLIDKMPAPWSLAFLPGGNILLTHRLPGSIRILNKQGVLSAPVTGVAELASPSAKGIGLLDVVTDPNYAVNHRIFFSFFDYIDGTNSNTCVARARFDESNAAITDAKVIFRALPAIPSKRLGGKTGGRIVFAPDGTLFVSTGDRSDSPPWGVAQQLDNHLGKILHITTDGAPAPDNPFLGKPGVLPEIWAYGIRNAEGMAMDPATGRLWENEHGPRGGDELNIIEKGKNYGWPVIVHGIDYPGNPIGAGITHQEGMEEPVYYWDPVIAPSGLAFYTGNLFPQWKGSIFVGGLRARMLDRLAIVNDKVVAEEPLLMELKDRIRDVRVGPDGAVYVLTDSGTAGISPNTPLTSKLLKLTPR
jgi:glucose/arabinose dehydrogenase/mono/diheme cytochrome c family protein